MFPVQTDARWVVALSDLHIGDASPTCWYQPDVHEEHLVAILDWVIEHADRVHELVLLGDVVDLWTYPFGRLPPTFAEIIAANPTLFGPHGAFCRVLDALDGSVTWVVGNHDMGITEAQVGHIVSAGGHALRLAPGLEHHPFETDRRLLMSHGHRHALFNAIDTESPWGVPAGHFVTRAVAEHWHRHLPKGATVADLPGQGAPNGVDLRGMSAAIGGLDSAGVIGLFFDFLDGALDVDSWDPLLMPDGSVATLAQARREFATLWQRWADASGGGRQGQIEAARATHADAAEVVGWYAQSDAVLHGADFVVMGHTHQPVSGIDHSPIGYLNTGFSCPSATDMAPGPLRRPVTFGVVEVAADRDAEITGQVWEAVDVGAGIECRPIDAPAEDISRFGTMDFSTHIEIDHRHGASDLRLAAAEVTRGRFVHPPPATIAAGTRARVWIQDDLGPFGSAGTLRYTGDDGSSLLIEASCPTGFSANRCRSNAPFVARSGDRPVGAVDDVPTLGHPLIITIRT